MYSMVHGVRRLSSGLTREVRETVEFLIIAGRSGRDLREMMELVAAKAEGPSEVIIGKILAQWHDDRTLGLAMQRVGHFPLTLCRLAERDDNPVQLADTLAAWLDEQRRSDELWAEVSNRMTLPILECLMAIFVVCSTCTFVMPQMISIMESLEASVKSPARFDYRWLLHLLSVHWLWFALLLTGFIVLFIRTAIKAGGLSAGLWALLRPIPAIHGYTTSWACCGFGRHLGLHLKKGLPLQKAFRESCRAIDLKPLKEDVERVISLLEEGRSLDNMSEATNILPSLFWLKLRAGMDEGAPERALAEFDKFCETRLRRAASLSAAVLNPLAVTITASIVAIMAISYFNSLYFIVNASLESL